MVKTITLSGTETEVSLSGGKHVIVKNNGDTAIYASKSSDIQAKSDGVYTINSGELITIENALSISTKDWKTDFFGSLFLKGTGDVQLITTNTVNFRAESKGGGTLSVNVSELKEDLSVLDKSIDNDNVFHHLNLKHEVINPTTGEVDTTDLRAWSDESYYEVLAINEAKSTLVVPDGYSLRCYYYDENKVYKGNNEAQSQTLRLVGGWKYVRFSIKTYPNYAVFDLTNELRNSVIISEYKIGNTFKEDKFNTIAVGDGKITPDFERGFIRDGANTSTYDYYSTAYRCGFIETSTINSVEMPQGYKVFALYYNANKVYVTGASYTEQFSILKTYAYVRFAVRKTDNSVFTLNLDGFLFNSTTINEKIGIVSNKVDILNDLKFDNMLQLPTIDRTLNGITIETYNEGYIIQGTATQDVYFILFQSEKNLIEGVEKGKRYLLEFNGLKSKLNIQVRYYSSDGSWVYLCNTYYNPIFTIPDDAVGMQIRMFIQNTKVIPQTYVSPKLYYTNSIGYAKRFKNKSPKPMITIIYDDGEKEFKNYILPIIQSKKVPISTAIITEYVESGDNPVVMTYDEILNCYKNGAEVLTHTIAMSESEWDELGYREISMRYMKAKHILESHGMNIPSTMVYSGSSAGYPSCYKGASIAMKSAIAAGSAGVKTDVPNYYGEIDRYFIQRCYSDGASVDTMKSWIDNLYNVGTGWQVWMRHNTQARRSMGSDDTAEQDASKLSEVIDYAIEKGIDIVTVERGLYEYLGI